MTTLLAAHELHARYGDSHVLRGVTVQVHAGRSLGLLGRNGMGKTTLIRTVLGYVRAAGGSVAWQGRALTGAPPEKMARLGIGYVPEGRGIFPNLSVRENLVMTARAGPGGARTWTLERVLATFPRLAERLGHGGQQLSGGEQQMLAIGRALVLNPRLLLLDEPLEGLAPILVEELLHALRRIVREEGLSAIVVEQNPARVLAMTDHALILERGTIVHSAASADLLADPETLERYLAVGGGQRTH